MKTQISNKNNKNLKNIKEIAKILYLLKINGFTQQNIAKDLNITGVAVTRSIYGLSTVSRVDEWLKNNIGYEEED